MSGSAMWRTSTGRLRLSALLPWRTTRCSRPMLRSDTRKIPDGLAHEARGLDVGGAARPFPRADWVIDLMSYDARGQLGWDGDREAERFDSRSWVQRDICDREPWPFSDRQC